MDKAIITTMPEQYRPHRHWKKILLAGLLLPIIVVIALWRLGTEEVPESHASRTYLQTATDWAKIDNFISTEFPKTPQPGSLLVAVVSNSHAAAIEPPLGWFEAINETQYSPGQAVFYKIAAQNEDRVVTVSRIDRRINLGLQIFEYPGVDPENPIDMVASSAGNGLVLHSGTLSTTSDKSLLIAAFTAARRENFGGMWNNDFSLRNVGQTKGDGLISFALADRVVGESGRFDTALALTSPLEWRGQIVAFHRLDQSLRQAAEEDQADLAVDLSVSNENPEPGESVSYTLTARNNGSQGLTNVFVRTQLPEEVALREAGISQGRYAPVSGMWEIGSLPPGQAATLNLHTYVKDRTYGYSAIASASLYIMEQIDSDETNDEAFAMIDIQKAMGTRRQCPEITNITFDLAQGQATTDSRAISLAANAAGASYVLLGETDNRLSATYHSLSADLEYQLSPGAGQKTLYAWFMNFCDDSPIQKQEIIYAPAAQTAESLNLEGSGSTEDTQVAATADIIPLPNEAETGTVATSDLLEESESDDGEESASQACGLTYVFTFSMVPEDTNYQVRRLQEVLQCLGYFPAEQATTAIYGPVTQQAVKDFQAAHNIEPVGYVGPSTIQALNQYTQ